MSLADNVRDRRALLMRLIVAEALAKPGEGPLAPRFASRARANVAKREPSPDDDIGDKP